MNAAEKASQSLTYLQKYAPDMYGKYLEFTKSSPNWTRCRIRPWN